MREFLKIVAIAAGASVFYGLVHDQITIRICPAYFTVFHPPIFPQNNLTVPALCWGVAATCWAGVLSGILLALAARAGREPRIAAAELVKPIGILLIVMAVCAAVAGFMGYHYAKVNNVRGMLVPGDAGVGLDVYPPLIADWWTHTASYVVGFAGAIMLSAMTLVRRFRKSRTADVQASGLPISQ